MATQGWAAKQAARIGQEVRRLRKPRSAQWLAARTKELGHHVTRAQITDLENRRRTHVTTAELAVLARALNTSPIALMFPGPYDSTVEVLPSIEASEIRAVQWFSGIPSFTEGVVVGLADDPVEYKRNLRRLRVARDIWNLDEDRIALMAQMAAADERNDEKAKAQLIDALADRQRRIDELKADNAW